MRVKRELLRCGVFLAAVFVAFGWATVRPVARAAAARRGLPQAPGRILGRDGNLAVKERRVALVVGNGSYQVGRLKNPPNDARAMSAALKELGFEVETVVDANLQGLQRAARDFGTRLKAQPDSVGLFYYAGHGVQVGGRNYLVPVGADVEVQKEADVEIYCLDADKVLRQMEEAGGRVNIVILDACRNNPFRGFGRDGGGGLAEVQAPSGTLIGYATDPGKTASDGDGENGLYTEALLKAMRTPGLRVEDVFNAAGAEVERRSGKRQQPWMSSKLRGVFYFRPPEGGAVGGESPGAAAVDGERAAWKLVEGSDDPRDVAAFLKAYPNGAYAGAARVKLEILERRRLSSATAPADGGGASGGAGVSAGAQPPAGTRAGQVWVSPAGIRLVWIPPGTFEMGSNNGDGDEKPVHRVTLTQGFWLGETEVTQAQWEAVMGANPSHFKDCPTCPVERVSWDDCQHFVKELNKRYPLGAGLAWRLPTEAEWEYACRAGTTGDYAGYLEAMCWYADNSGKRTHEVGRKRPNDWGLYDMHGNVWEWCADWYQADYYRISPEADPRGPGSGEWRVLRGGSWHFNAPGCRAANRHSGTPTNRDSNLGLRVAVGAP